MAQYWLMKSEPDECSIDDALKAPHATVPWTGVRNYQARNFMRDAMRVGDGVLFYHSSCPEPGIAGIARVASEVEADPTQFDPASPYFDPKSDPLNLCHLGPLVVDPPARGPQRRLKWEICVRPLKSAPTALIISTL